jgi:hypothetical protein
MSDLSAVALDKVLEEKFEEQIFLEKHRDSTSMK